MKTGKKKLGRGKIVLIVVGCLVLALAVLVLVMLPKPVKLEGGVNLARVADGAYTGSCENGLVAATMRVTVENHAITGVELLEHRNGLGGAADGIVNAMAAAGTPEVDTVSGATLSSLTIRKAAENALLGAMEGNG